MSTYQTPPSSELSDKTRKTCERILALDDFDIYMGAFKTEHECGTSYCIAGRLAFLDGFPSEFNYFFKFTRIPKFSFSQYSWSLIQHNEMIWSWLFDSSWPNSLEHAKQRAAYLIKYGAVPYDFTLLRTEDEFRTYPLPN